jgi:Protein of unknown function (DUF4127)
MRWFLALTAVAIVMSTGFSSTRALQNAPIALIPLDSRPATATLPVDIAAVAGERVMTPPLESLGTASAGANRDQLLGWLDQTTARALVVSLDAVAYGGLVQSRTSELSADQAWQNLEPIKAWHQRVKAPVYAFITIPRAPEATNRERNLEVIRKAFDWAEDGTLERLYVVWDDALPDSPAPKEGERLRLEATVRNLANVLVYPGADEAASTLLSSLILKERERQVKVKLEFSDPEKSLQNIVYEGQSLEASAQMQARAAGLEIVGSGQDLTLYVFNGGDMRTAALRLSALLRKGPVALVDVAEVNKAASRLIDDTVTLQRFMQLQAFAAWGTPGNNLGSALAQAAMRSLEGDENAQMRLLFRSYVNDYLYSTIVRPKIRALYDAAPLDTDVARAELLELLRASFQPQRLSTTQCLSIADADFPWARSFEVRLEVTIKDQSQGCR